MCSAFDGKRLSLGVVAMAMLLLVGLAPAGAPAGSARACKPVINPYDGTRYEGTNLSRIRAIGVSCRVARRVARRAHRKGLGMTPPPSGIRRYRWHGWRVTGDLRPASDRYVARKGDKRVRWRF
jgi:hypothetical protein